MKIKSVVLCVLSGILAFACSPQRGPTIASGKLTLTYNDSLYTKIEFTDAGEPFMTNFQPSEILRTDDQVVSDFVLQDYQTESFTDERGSGQRLMIDGLANGDVELRGLTHNVEYELVNYETGESLGSVQGPGAHFEASFSDHLMIQARIPE